MLLLSIQVLPIVTANVSKSAMQDQYYEIDYELKSIPFEILQTMFKIIISCAGVIVTFTIGLTTTVIQFLTQITIALLSKLNLCPKFVTKLINLSEQLDKILLFSLLLFVAFSAYLTGLFENLQIPKAPNKSNRTIRLHQN